MRVPAGAIPAWFDEGLAVIFEPRHNERHPGRTDMCAFQVNAAKRIPLGQMCAPSLGKGTKSPGARKKGNIGVSAAAIGAIPQKAMAGTSAKRHPGRVTVRNSAHSCPIILGFSHRPHVLGVVIRPDPARADAVTIKRPR